MPRVPKHSILTTFSTNFVTNALNDFPIFFIKKFEAWPATIGELSIFVRSIFHSITYNTQYV